jgi:(p)ppGpp synthase/HD superfamily hydrolase
MAEGVNFMNVADKAKEFAIAKHATQKYGAHPYSYHLAQVSQVLSQFGCAGDEAIAAAGWLHDVLEDTPTTYEMLMSEFGNEVADIVFAVTSEPGENRADRFRKTALKIQSNKKALIVKLADRIANTEASFQSNPKLYKMYLKEFPLFKELLYNPQYVELMPMWNRLENSHQ